MKTRPQRVRATAQVLLGVLLALACGLTAAADRGFTVEDLVMMDRISDPRLSPDAKSVAYTLRETDFDANKASTSIWVQAVAGGAPRRLTATGSSANSPRWSADGSALYFLSSRSGSMQLWRLDMAGGEAQAVTAAPLDVGSYALAPNGNAVALSFEVFLDCTDLACTKTRLDERADVKRTGVVHDKLFVRHWDTWKNGLRNQLFVAKLGADGKASETLSRVSRGIDGDVPTKPFGGDEDYTFAPDSRSMVFTVRIAGKTEAWSTNMDLFSASIDGDDAPTNLTAANSAHDSHPTFSNDGKTLYFTSMKRPTFEADQLVIKALDLVSGSMRDVPSHSPACAGRLRCARWDASADGVTLNDDGKRIYTTATESGRHPLFVIDVKTGNVAGIAGDGAVEAFDVRGNTLVFTRSTLSGPAQLFAANADGSKVRQLSQFNADKLAGVKFGEFSQFSFPGWNDETVSGYVVKPWNYEAGKKYPVALIIHGGPQGSMGNSFHYRWNAQTYAGQGMAVVFIDFHGSTGYGQDFTDSISGDWGGKPLEDLQKGWAHALNTHDFLDGDRACALGGSYGGYMVNWIAGNWPKAWKCLVSHAGIFDNRSMGYVTEELWFSEWEMGGPQFQVPGNYEKHNPVNHVGKWQTPMLVIHGQLDYRVPVEQGLAAFSALQRLGVESKFLYFPDENHWILKPHNSVQWHTEVNAWLKRWTAE
ncbi:MAG: prolyl oligopeptidase family serine peptidase [Pseudomarimonas sp.]